METEWPGSFPVIRTERLLLRRVSPGDSAGIYSCYSDPDTMKYLGTPLDDRLSAAGIVEDYISGFEEGHNLVWSLETLCDGTFLGTAGFEEFSFLDFSAETGFTLLQEHRGRGYMAEAMREILTCGFQRIGLNRIEARIHPGNLPAVKLVEKLGFRREGHLRKSVFFRGGFHDQLIYGLLREGSH